MGIDLVNSKPQPISHLTLDDFPRSLSPQYTLKIAPPELDDFLELFRPIPGEQHDYLVLSTPSCLPSIYENALLSAKHLQRQGSIQVIDTLTVHAGVDYLLRKASQLSRKGIKLNDIVADIREEIPHIFCLLCIPNLTYLSNLGIIDPAQAAVGELLGWMPVYVLDAGRLHIMDKFQSTRQVFDCFGNFLAEFPSINQIMLIRKMDQPDPVEIAQFHDFFYTRHPGARLIEMPITIPFSAMFGPDVFGMIVVEHTSQR
jgi:DegV family protein with EDD domain